MLTCFLLLIQSLFLRYRTLSFSPSLKYCRSCLQTWIHKHLCTYIAQVLSGSFDQKCFDHKMFEQSVDLGTWIMPKIEKISKCIIIDKDIISNQLRNYKYRFIYEFFNHLWRKKQNTKKQIPHTDYHYS